MNVEIPAEDLKKLLANIRLAFGNPGNKAAWSLGRASVTTLEDYLAAHELKREKLGPRV